MNQQPHQTEYLRRLSGEMQGPVPAGQQDDAAWAARVERHARQGAICPPPPEALDAVRRAAATAMTRPQGERSMRRLGGVGLALAASLALVLWVGSPPEVGVDQALPPELLSWDYVEDELTQLSWQVQSLRHEEVWMEQEARDPLNSIENEIMALAEQMDI